MSRPQMIGTISEFDSSVDDWNVYYERLEQFFDVNDVPDAKRSAFLISVIGASAYKSLRDLCHPIAPKDKPFVDLCELLRKQFSPQISIFRERACFYNTRQEYHENATQWYGKLKRLSVNCKFGESLQSILMDKFITGLRPGQVLDRLCEENETLKLEQALDIAVNKECAAKENAYAPVRPFYKPQICPAPRLQTCYSGGQPARPEKPQTENFFATNTLCSAPKQLGFKAPAAPFGGSGGTGLFGSPALASAPAPSLFGKPAEGAGFAFRSQTEPLAAAPASSLFAASTGGFGGFGAPAPQSDSVPLNLESADETLAVDNPPALGGANLEVPSVEQTTNPTLDGLPEGANRVGGTAKRGRGGRVRTRRRGAARRGGAGDAADKASVDGEQEA
ncbi:uncharacterized protein LOC129721461 [Wyeomyia smithii]|uniref:uncharacterized protein LOC129721461 n=1 Tax=Wyeomyia smithii TaxID=174621 RepID=UPI0024680135|nr:uncharacterized protein LOC129721461 [Wyeomyia smithii]